MNVERVLEKARNLSVKLLIFLTIVFFIIGIFSVLGGHDNL